MKKCVMLVGCLVLLAGCSDSPEVSISKEDAGNAKPTTEQVSSSLSSHFEQSGWSNVTLQNVQETNQTPPGVKAGPDSWVFQFDAQYDTLIGDHKKASSWYAVVKRSNNQLVIDMCFDHRYQQITGHRGKEPEIMPASFQMPK